MAQKVETLPWNYFSNRVVTKEIIKLSKKFNWQKCVNITLVIAASVTFALLTGDHSSYASEAAVPAMAHVGGDTAEFSERLRQATKPIRDIIMSFGHEIYAVMMLWGGIEALIGKFQQGISRMKASTIAYLLLVWVPWIVDTVTATAQH